ncbi:WD40 repeat domain-containing protein [Rhizobium leguminosarum]|uniref:WD40 repeat domain-containing protein n=1 Tax=Rhizobium leguminosarum TaxID=384 RepID=UPI001C94292C|nr:WD40 repeat domain-containing protein [Rhizobium leguminosarum]MBY5612980.1 WD40 repeat domain-containing protein [Rhizobium leguminosarum]MBY5659934.1 WD40 repeat domain-containing protein [Rhizobium leguminosarum]
MIAATIIVTLLGLSMIGYRYRSIAESAAESARASEEIARRSAAILSTINNVGGVVTVDSDDLGVTVQGTLIRVETGQQVARLTSRTVHLAKFSPDEQIIVIAETGNQTVRLFNRKGVELLGFSVPGEPVVLDFMLEGASVFLVTREGILEQRSIINGAPTAPKWDVGEGVLNSAFSETGKRLAVAFSDKRVSVFDTASRRVVLTFDTGELHPEIMKFYADAKGSETGDSYLSVSEECGPDLVADLKSGRTVLDNAIECGG